MALQIWLPLNGNLENKGIMDISFSPYLSETGLAINSNGKLGGSCYERTAVQANSYRSNKTVNFNGDVTICCWAYMTGGSSDVVQGIVSNHNHGNNGSGFGINFMKISDSDYRISCSAGRTSSDRVYNHWYGTTNIKNAWHHLAFTYNRQQGQVKLYVDGKCEKVVNDYFASTGSNTIDLFAWSTGYVDKAEYRALGRINDVRFYDHCLSGKEISLVAQGLVAHYLLNNNGERQNLMNNSGNDVTGSEYRVTTYAFDKEGFGRYLNPGEKVTLTICFTPHANFGYWNPHLNGGAMGGWMPNIPSDGTTNRQIVSATSNSGWNYTTHPDTTPANANICMYCKTKDNNPNNAPVTIHWATLQIGNQPSEYWLPSRSDAPSNYNIEYDCSGYGNDATIIGPVTLQQNSSRYEFSSVFNGSTANIESYQDSTGWTDATISAWINPTTHVVNDGQDRSCIFIGGFYVTLTTSGKIATYCYGKNNPGYHTGSTTIPLNQWTHVVAVWNESTKEHIVYLNGKKEYTVSNCYGAGNTDWHKRKYIGRERWWAENHDNQYHRFFTGAISDIRLYTTPLSEADVIELYNTPISIGKTGAVMAGMFKEV